jgi:hypothetical protein
MDHARREFLVSRVVSGCLRCRITDRFGQAAKLLIKPPSREQRYDAQELYQEVFIESELQGCYSDQELLSFLLENSLWDEDREKLITGLPKEIEEFKVRLFKELFKSNERKVIRKALGVAKEKLEELTHQRNAYGYLSCSGAAAIARNRYLMGCSLYYPDGRPVFASDTFWDEPSDLLEQVIVYSGQQRLSETELRELARTDPWRSVWACRKSEGTVFGIAACDYTEDQSRLISYTVLYDSIFEHPECPADNIIGDDDMLDGWMIDQRRQREARQNAKHGEDLVGSEKVRGAQEVYLVADTNEDARKIDGLNDQFASAVKQARINTLNKQGVVNEAEMPDTRMKLRMEMNQLLSRK